LCLDRHQAVDCGEFLAEEVELSQGGIDGEALVGGQLLGAKARRGPCA